MTDHHYSSSGQVRREGHLTAADRGHPLPCLTQQVDSAVPGQPGLGA
ncbi:MAG: hypothetical protein WKF73_20970 [Nocardioidaceae bacterium]